MYVVINIQSNDHVLRLVELLFQNGFPSVGVCDSLKDACPDCNSAGESSATKLEGTYTQQTDPTSMNRKRKAPASNGKETHKISPPKLNLPLKATNARRSTRSNTSIELKPESREISTRAKENRIIVDDDELIEDIPNTSAEYNSMLDGDTSQEFEEDLEMDIKPDIKRYYRNGPKDTIPCQICNRKIVHGDNTNAVNHLSRHARLHAVKKQFCCGICGYQTTRRYICVNHIRDYHPDIANSRHHVIDNAKELREIYIELLDRCFPGIRGTREGVRSFQDFEKKLSQDEDAEEYAHDDLVLSDSG